MALCTPNESLKKLQDENQLSELMVMQEELKTFPFGDIWEEYCKQNHVKADSSWFEDIKVYEQDVLQKR